MNAILRSALAVAGLAMTTQAIAQVTFYEHEGFQGRTFSAEEQVGNLARSGFNDLASSVVVQRDRWEVCEDAGFNGRCIVLRPGRYSSLGDMGLNDRISSARIVSRNARVEDDRYAPQPGYAPAAAATHDYHRRGDERLYEATVTSVRAVVGPPEQRCWVEHQTSERSGANVPGAIAGAVIGGIIGHQVGSGRHQDLATAGGAVAGGALGANVGRSGGGQVQDVQRCENVSSQARPDHWDVTYIFRGQEHRIQMTNQPGPTVTVNEQGEPRA